MNTRSVAHVRRRQVARKLREAREAAGLTLEAAAARLDCSTSKLSRIETADQRVDVHWVRSMMDLYEVAGPDWTELLELTRASRARGWWRNYGLDDRGYVPLESEASLVRTFQTSHMPGLLQTEDYARALFRASTRRRTEAELERDVTVRMIRQRRLAADDPLELVAIVDEAMLHRPFGGPEVLRAQLTRLVEAAALPGVTFQVLPLGAAVRVSGSFTVLSFGDLGEPDLVYVEYFMGATHIDKAELVAASTLTFDRLRSEALSPLDSVELVDGLAARS